MDAEEAEMLAVLSGENPEAPAALTPEPPDSTPVTPPADDTPVPPVDDTPPGGQPKDDPTDEPAAPTDKGRFRLEGQDAHFARLRREGVSAEEAIKIAYAKPETQGAPPADQPQNDLAAVDTELAEVRKQLDQFAADESLYTPEVRKAQQRELELVSQKARLEAAEQQAQAQKAQTEVQQFESAEAKSWENAIEVFPDIANPDSALAQKVKAEWDAIAANPKHPLYSLPDLPETLTAKHAAALRIAPKAATAAPSAPAKPAVTTPSGMPIQPLSGSRSAPIGQVTEAQREAQSLAALANAGSLDEFEALLGKDLRSDPSPTHIGYRL